MRDGITSADSLEVVGKIAQKLKDAGLSDEQAFTLAVRAGDVVNQHPTGDNDGKIAAIAEAVLRLGKSNPESFTDAALISTVTTVNSAIDSNPNLDPAAAAFTAIDKAYTAQCG